MDLLTQLGSYGQSYFTLQAVSREEENGEGEERAEKESVVRAETWEEVPVRVMSNFLVSGASSS